VRRACDHCGKKYEAKRQTSRYCSTACRMASSRAGQATPRSVTPLPAAGELTRAVEEKLAEASRLDTAEGRAAVDIAKRIDSVRAAPLSQVASAHRELRAALEAAMRGANQTKSVLQSRRDELAARRAKKQA
jgi:hypothetical protein